MNSKMAEAERRIEEALRTGAEWLDLGDLALEELPEPLAELRQLKRLALGVIGLDDEGNWYYHGRHERSSFTDLSSLSSLQWLQELSLSECSGVTDLRPLSSLQGLQELTFSRCSGVTDLSPLSSLQGLASLDLSGCSGVTDLSPLSSLQGLQELSFPDCSGVTDLSPLSSLQGLQKLKFSRCSGVTDLRPLSSLQRLASLDLSGCSGVTDLSPLSSLQGLERLDFSFCSGVTDLRPLSSLQVLQKLKFSRCSGVTDLRPLSSLQGLSSLDLFGCEGVTDLSPLSSLQGLARLDLSGCEGVTDLSPLSSLQGLASLDLSGCEGVTDLSPLSSIQGLASLDLSGCEGVTDLSPLSSLQGLQELNFSHCSGVTDLSQLSSLQGLQELNFSHCSGVTDLSPLSSLQGLQELNFSHCSGVTDLSQLSSLQGLQELNFSHCSGVTDLRPLSSLQGLASLDLSGCSGVTDISFLETLSLLTDLNAFACGAVLPKLQAVRFAGRDKLQRLICNRVAEVPVEVLSNHRFDNCLPRLRSHLAELEAAAEAENEVKIILLGNGHVGKTQLCRSFRGELPDFSIPSTHGVELWREPLSLPSSGGVETFHTNWWDFGGQDIYHGTHALFLRSRAVFLILWHPDLENQDEHQENGIPLRNQPLSYWLDYVRSLAGADSPVIVVQSQCDEFSFERPAPVGASSFGFARACAFSSQTGLGREALKGHILDAVRYLREKTGTLEIGQSRAEVRRRLYALRAENQATPNAAERKHRTLTLGQFEALCHEVGGIASPAHALDYFHQTGVVFYDPRLFSQQIVLDQSWALDAVYAVFDRQRAAPVLRDLGRFTREHLAYLVWQENSAEEQVLFLGLMESCAICFGCGTNDRGETEYIAPDLLPPFETVARKLEPWWEESGITTLRLEYRFFHQAILRGLMKSVGHLAQGVAEYWKYGFHLFDRKRKTHLLVRQLDTSRSEALGAGAVEIVAKGEDPLGLLFTIRQAIFGLRIGEQPEQLLSLDGVAVCESSLSHEIGGQVKAIDGRVVSASPYSRFFNARGTEDLKFMASETPRALELDPAPSEKKRPEVFLSYAWGDDTPEGKRRGEVVDRIQGALTNKGFYVERDRDSVRPGERISRFMNRLTNGDCVVVILSGKYLRSWPCMYEIYRIYQKCQADANAFAARVVPIVLPEVKLDLGSRVEAVEHWLAEKARCEQIGRDFGIHLGAETWDEIRLTAEFAQHVDPILKFVDDILMPRNLETHFENDFEALIEALLRRLVPTEGL